MIAKRADEWDKLFHRKNGWTGADGIYSIPISGNETINGSSSEKTLFVFSDTFISRVTNNDRRLDWTIVNNTHALLDGNMPLEEKTQFFWNQDSENQPLTLFVPETPQSQPGDWYWLMDGIMLENTARVFALRMKSGVTGIFNFKIAGVALISFQLDGNGEIQAPLQEDAPIFYENPEDHQEMVFGQALMPMLPESGTAGADGYIYVYGPLNSAGTKALIASRIKPADLQNYSAWRYWDGTDWVSDIRKSAPITDGISQEFSMSPLENGTFLLTFQNADDICIRIGKSPIGPFGPMKRIYKAPEPSQDPDVYAYNAKAHPHLSRPAELLISYNVNTLCFADHVIHSEIYRPRFIWLPLKEIV